MRFLRTLSVTVLLLALAVAVLQQRGLPESARARLQAALAAPPVAAAVARLRAVLPQVGSLLPAVPESGCSCEVRWGAEADGRWQAVRRWLRQRAAECNQRYSAEVQVVVAGWSLSMGCAGAQLAWPPHPSHLQGVSSADSEDAACNLAGHVIDCCEWGRAVATEAVPKGTTAIDWLHSFWRAGAAQAARRAACLRLCCLSADVPSPRSAELGAASCTPALARPGQQRRHCAG